MDDAVAVVVAPCPAHPVAGHTMRGRVVHPPHPAPQARPRFDGAAHCDACGGALATHVRAARVRRRDVPDTPSAMRRDVSERRTV